MRILKREGLFKQKFDTSNLYASIQRLCRRYPGSKWGVSAKDAALLKPEIRKVVFSRRQGRGTI